jgi:fumarate hydratase subunit alpha
VTDVVRPAAESPATHLTVRDIDVAELRALVARLLVEANCRIPDDILAALRGAIDYEESPLGRQTLAQLVENYEVAAAERRPVCQDSGVTVVHLEVGQDVHWTGGLVTDAVHDGVREGTRSGFLRASVTADPLVRRNTGDNAPGIVHVELVPGDRVRVTVASKGFGAENMSALRMFTPSDGRDAVKRFVVETVERAGANACPPIVVGVGVGGTFETAALLAKKAVLRSLDRRHPRDDLRRFEQELLEDINDLGIGPQGLGGRVTALAVNIEVYPTHIAGLPVAVNLGCHSNRRMTAEL